LGAKEFLLESGQASKSQIDSPMKGPSFVKHISQEISTKTKHKKEVISKDRNEKRTRKSWNSKQVSCLIFALMM
jgi:hypothetical protein